MQCHAVDAAIEIEVDGHEALHARRDRGLLLGWREGERDGDADLRLRRLDVSSFIKLWPEVLQNVLQRIEFHVAFVSRGFRDHDVADGHRAARRQRPLALARGLRHDIEQVEHIDARVRLDDVGERCQCLLGLHGCVGKGRVFQLCEERQPVLEHKQIVRLQFVSLPQCLDSLLRRRLTRRHWSQQVKIVPHRSRLRCEFARLLQRDLRLVDFVRANRDAGVEHMRDVRVRLDLGQQFQRLTSLGEHLSVTTRLARGIDRAESQLAADRQIARPERIVGHLPDDVAQQFVGLGELMVLQQRDRSIPLVEQFNCFLPRELRRCRATARPSGLWIESSHDEDEGHQQGCRHRRQQRRDQPQIARRLRLRSVFHQWPP